MDSEPPTALANFISELATFLSEVLATGVMTYIGLLVVGFVAGYGFFRWQSGQRREARRQRRRQRKSKTAERRASSDADG